jgi:membrane associated rhomboid family serine protease
MAMYRRYTQGEYRPQFGGFSFFPPVLKNIILLNVVIFIIQQFFVSGMFTFGGQSTARWFVETFYLMPLGYGFRPWQLVTYMFLHGGFAHIFINMLMLWMFGMEIENTWGSRKFLFFYFATGLAAGLANLFIAPLFSAPGPTIGASGSVYGVLVAFAMMFPDRYVYLYFLLPIRAKYLIAGFIGLEVYYGVSASGGNIAHIAHLGGALVGAIWVWMDNRGMIDRMFWKLDSARTPSSSSGWGSTREATFHDINDAPTPTKPKSEFDESQKAIDRILDKISVSGYGSLTEDEKRILLDASRKIHPDRNAGD